MRSIHIEIFPLLQSEQAVRINSQHFDVAPSKPRWRETLLNNRIWEQGPTRRKLRGGTVNCVGSERPTKTNHGRVRTYCEAAPLCKPKYFRNSNFVRMCKMHTFGQHQRACYRFIEISLSLICGVTWTPKQTGEYKEVN